MSKLKIIILLILSFGTGVFVGYLLLGYLRQDLAFSGIAQWIGGSLTLAWVIDLLSAILKDIRQEKQNTHNKLVEQLAMHTNDLKSMLKKLAVEPLFSSDEIIFIQMKKHIQTGYPELWNILEGNNGIRVTSAKLFDIEKQLEEQITTAVRKVIPQNLALSEQLIPLFVEKIRDSIEKRLYKNIIMKFNIAGTHLRYETSSFAFTDYECNNISEKEKIELSGNLNAIIYNTELEIKFNNFHGILEQQRSNRESFAKKLNEIIDYIEHSAHDEGKILLGKCKYCSNSKK